MMKLNTIRRVATFTTVLCMSLASACAAPMSSEEIHARIMGSVDQSRHKKIASGAEGYMDSVYQYLSAGELSKAIKSCKEIREIRPNDDAVLFAEGYAYFGKGEYSDAINSLSAALAVDGARSDALYFRARSYRKLGEYNKSLEDLNVVISNPKPATQIVQFARAINNDDISTETIKGNMYWLQARLYSRLNDVTLAKASIDRAIQHIPNSSLYFQDRGRYSLFQNKLGPAYNDFERAIELDPSRSGPWNFAGGIDLTFGRYDKAVMRFQKAYAIDPGRVDIVTNYGLAHWLLGDQVKAFELMGKALRGEPGYTTYYHIAYFHHLSGRQDKAMEYYKKAYALNSDIIEIRTTLASSVPAISPTQKFYRDQLETAKVYIESGKTPAEIAQNNNVPTFEITEITVHPNPVPVNKSFDFHVHFEVNIPNSSDAIIPTMLNFKILRGNKVLHTSESYFINTNNGESKKWVLHMNPVRKKGSYAVHVTIKYKTKVSEKIAQLQIN